MQMLKNWNPEQIPEKDDIRERLSSARSKLYELQMALKEHKIPVLVLFEGWGASGKGSVISKVIKNIDPRFFKVATMAAPTEEDLRKPFLYRYFKEIPEAGKFTFLDSGWMDQTCRERMDKKLKGDSYVKRVDSIRRFERQLTDNGYVLLKFFMQIDKDEQEKETGKYIRRERYAGACQRSFYVGEDITEEDIKAEFKHGILKLFVPKKEVKPAVEEKKYISIEG